MTNNPADATIRKSAFGRTNLFLTTSGGTFREVKCTASVSHQPNASVFHMHPSCTLTQNPKSVCWHCCEEFDTQGIRLPRLYDSFERVFHVYGWFCSPACGKAYILEHTTFDRGQQMSVFAHMLRQVYNITDNVVEAPPRIALKRFGGIFDIKSFREQHNICIVQTPPFVSYCMIIEERNPIASIGEGAQPTQRGSVRGLRKPTTGSVPLNEHEQIRSPEITSMYESFLASNGADKKKDEEHTENGRPSCFNEPVPKRPKREAKANAAANPSQGLGRFMSTR